MTGGAQATWIAIGWPVPAWHALGHTPRAGGEIKEMMAPYTSWSVSQHLILGNTLDGYFKNAFTIISPKIKSETNNAGWKLMLMFKQVIFSYHAIFFGVYLYFLRFVSGFTGNAKALPRALAGPLPCHWRKKVHGLCQGLQDSV